MDGRQFRIECVRGDIASQGDMDAVVCAANPQLAPGAGTAGAIHAAAGPGLYAEAAPLAPLATGDAILTGAHGLPNRGVLHTVGPIYGRDKPSGALLASCFRRCLEEADRAGLESVAFPAISTGVYGYPLGEAASVALKAILGTAPRMTAVRHVRIVLWSAEDLEVFQRTLKELEAGG